MFKRILIVLVAVLIVFGVIGLLLPRYAHVERSVTIDRPASLVFATVNSFQLFPRWSPWQALDPNMHQSTSGPRDGVGAKLAWSGNDKIGTGSQVITASTPDKSVASDLDFGNMGVAKSTLLLAAEGPRTRTTWTLDIDMGGGPIGHYFGLMMDRMIGKDYDSGLAKLKALVEGMPDTDIAGFNVELVELTAMPILVVSESAPLDTPSILTAYADGYAQIAKFMAKNKLRQTGTPIGIDGEMTTTTFSFQAGMPIDRNDVTGSGTVQATHSYAGKALKTPHIGPYDTLPKTYEKFRAYMAAHAFIPKGPALSWYVDDPTKTAPDQLRTEIYWPVQ